MFLKSTKQAYAKLLQTRQSLSAAKITSSLTASSTAFTQCSSMAFRSGNRAFRPVMSVMGSMPQRAFSLPDHIVLEMPNLSPTMEKVSVSSLRL